MGVGRGSGPAANYGLVQDPAAWAAFATVPPDLPSDRIVEEMGPIPWHLDTTSKAWLLVGIVGVFIGLIAGAHALI